MGGICGALLTNLSAWLSGTWFDLNLVGGAFKAIADMLPFSHAVNAARCALAGDYAGIMPELIWVIVYATMVMLAAVLAFTGRMRGGRA